MKLAMEKQLAGLIKGVAAGAIILGLAASFVYVAGQVVGG